MEDELDQRLIMAIKAISDANIALTLHKLKGVETQYKDAHFDIGSIVTQADFESEKRIVGWIEKFFPGDSIYSEEKGWQKKKGAKYTWYIDPLDGTSNFVRDIPLYGISIGLESEGQAVLGVLGFPELNMMLLAKKGRGAYQWANPAFQEPIRISVSDRELEKSLYYGGGYYKGRFGTIRNLAERTGMLKIDSSSAYDLAQIARGNAELYVLNSVPHDVVAGVCIVQEAGGKITDFQGNPWHIHSEGIVVSNGVIHDEVIGILGKSQDQIIDAFGRKL